jgi:hypothetical protein
MFARQQLARCFTGNLGSQGMSNLFTALQKRYLKPGKHIVFIVVLYGYFNVGTLIALLLLRTKRFL